MEITNRELIDRYAFTLESLGIFISKDRQLLNIDSVGFSFDIAKDLSDEDYLGQYALIVSSEQIEEGLKQNNDIHMQLLFKTMQKDIKKYHEILLHTTILIKKAYTISNIQDYIDLTKCRFVISIPYEVKKIRNKQINLIKSGLENDNIVSLAFYEELYESIKNYGDLRELPEENIVVCQVPDSFYTSAFGGIYVLRQQGMVPIVISKQELVCENLKGCKSFYIDYPDLLEYLRSHGLINLRFSKPRIQQGTQHILKDMWQQSGSFIWQFEDVIKNEAYRDKILISMESLPLSNQYKTLQKWLERGTKDMQITPAIRKSLQEGHVMAYFCYVEDEEQSLPSALKKTLQKLLDDIAFYSF